MAITALNGNLPAIGHDRVLDRPFEIAVRKMTIMIVTIAVRKGMIGGEAEVVANLEIAADAAEVSQNGDAGEI